MTHFFQRARLPKLAAILGSLVLLATTLATAPASGDPFGNDSFAAPDSAGLVGLDPSMQLNADGYPVIAYYDAANTALKFVACTNSDCSGTQTPRTLDSVGIVGLTPSLALTSVGNPVISYYDATNNRLKVLRCSDPACANPYTVVIVDDDGDVGSTSSIVVDAKNLPRIAYHDSTNGDLKFVACASINCGDTPTPEILDSAGDVGANPSMVLDESGRPAIAYEDDGNDDLRVIRCSNATCSGAQTAQAPDTTGIVGLFPSLVLDGEDRPVISSFDGTNNTLRVMRCSNTLCSGAQVAQTPDTNPGAGPDSSIALNSAGYPVISYWRFVSNDLHVLECTNADCSGTQTPSIPDTVGSVGLDTSLALDVYGNPIVAYYDADNGDLKVLHCYDVEGCGGQDQDQDGVLHAEDNCAEVANPTQLDVDGDGSGVACDSDEISLPSNCETPAGINVIRGTSGKDTLVGTSGPDIILGFGGKDTIRGKGGNDCILGGSGADNIKGGPGNDVIKGQKGNDTIRGKSGNDIIRGNKGKDRIWGNNGTDRIWGGTKADTINGGNGTDTCKGGPGPDTITRCEN